MPAVPPDLRGTDTADRDTLAELGWDDAWRDAYLDITNPPDAQPVDRDGTTSTDTGRWFEHEPWRPGRVLRVDRGSARVRTHHGSIHAPLPNRGTPAGDHLISVVTGDWVLVDADDRVRAALPRRTALERGIAGRGALVQPLAANVDLVLVVLALVPAPNLGRLDRLLALAWQSGAAPVVVLSKADLSADPEPVRADVTRDTLDAPVHVVSALDGRGLDEVRAHLATGRTLVTLGTSGAGKSSLVNALAGTEVLPVGPIRSDGKGRHTTTARELIVLPGLGVLIDTPGLRGVKLWDADDGVDQTFADVEELAAHCRFGDCEHRTEPGCAVRAAVDEGRLSPRRVASYEKLRREMDWLRRRQDARARAEESRRGRARERVRRDMWHR